MSCIFLFIFLTFSRFSLIGFLHLLDWFLVPRFILQIFLFLKHDSFLQRVYTCLSAVDSMVILKSGYIFFYSFLYWLLIYLCIISCRWLYLLRYYNLICKYLHLSLPLKFMLIGCLSVLIFINQVGFIWVVFNISHLVFL